MFSAIKRFWNKPAGGNEVLKIAFPLILSTGSHTVQMFVDRMFLSWYDTNAMSGSMFAGMMSFTIFSLFLGTTSYANTFVAQYDGSQQYRRIGAAVWQGIYFALLAGAVMYAISFASGFFVELAGHSPQVRNFENIYFKIITRWSIFALLATALSSFYTGRGKTWTVMLVNIVATAVNILLDYAMIFGKWGLPGMGVAGAAWATILSAIFSVVIFAVLICRKEYRIKYATLCGWFFDGKLFKRLMRFGLPSGIHFHLDMLGFTIFLTFIGRMGADFQAATSLAWQINTLAFLPMIGLGIATTTLVGRNLGANDPPTAATSTWSAAAITFSYMMLVSLCYVFVPDIFTSAFKKGMNPDDFNRLAPMIRTLLLFVAAYSLLDGGNIVFAAALKGAGDTRFVMYFSVGMNWLLMVLPSWLCWRFLEGSAAFYGAWTALAVFVCALAIMFFLRFIHGKWKTMRVIEMPPAAMPVEPPTPTT